ncbi:DoxX family protein [Gaetbulibacter sp. M235]|uniref:DoxX family protein n=1 Tax=Gaetbulibacter sp. M235 TaxID=3126510 RepID=UPI00374F8C8B
MKKVKQITINELVGVVRILLGIIFMMTGIMKLTLPDYGAAWSIQLVEAKIPFYTVTYYFVPLFEIFLGLFLFLGYHSRLSALMVLPIMFVAIYVHLTVTNPGAFPSQPQEPYMPIAVIMMALIILRKGSGRWSLDLISQLKIHQ